MLADLFPLGLKASYRRLVLPEELHAYGKMVGDLDPIHHDEAFCRRTPYGKPIVHGTMLIGFMSAASTQATSSSNIPLVSLGYDRLRFVGPAFPHEEIEALFVVVGHDEAKQRIFADVEVRSNGRLVAVAHNILKRIA